MACPDKIPVSAEVNYRAVKIGKELTQPEESTI